MAVFDIRDTLKLIESYAAGTGYFKGGTIIGQPKAPPEGLTASIYMVAVRNGRLYVNGGTGEVHIVRIEMYRNAMHDPEEDIEMELAQVAQQVKADLLGDYDLGATINHIDTNGIYGVTMDTEWGFKDINNVMFRVATMILPLVIDDSATAVK